MADYVAILSKAVSGLADNNHANREIIYQKARMAIDKKLRAIEPTPSQEVINGQLGQLENAIGEVEALQPASETLNEASQADDTAIAQAIAQADTQAEQATETPLAAPLPHIPDANPPTGFVDDVILIDGIGEKTASLLKEEGITGISQIAEIDAGLLGSITEKIGYPGFELTQEWKTQSYDMLSGKLPRSKTDQERLKKYKLAMQTGPLETQEPEANQVQEPAPVEPPITVEPAKSEAAAVEPVKDATPPVEPVLEANRTVPVEPVMSLETSSQEAPSIPAEPVAEVPSIDPNLASLDSRGDNEISPSVNSPAFISELDGDEGQISNKIDPHLTRPLAGSEAPRKKSRGGFTGLIILALIGGIAAAAYTYREPIMTMGKKAMGIASELMAEKEDKTVNQEEVDSEQKAEEPAVENTVKKDDARLGEGEPKTEPAKTGEENLEPIKIAEPEDMVVPDNQDDTPSTVEVEGEPKANEPAVVENTGEEAVVSPQDTPADTAEPETAKPADEETTAAAEAIVEGEKAYLYEEAVGNAGASRDEGGIVWSLVQEAPEEGAEPESVIKGVLEIPGRGLTMNITIKRNVDAALPASHIIELLFTAPPEFSGVNVDGLSRFVMKPTEQARGESLIGVPARIDTGYFYLALNNLDQAQKTNMQLLSNAKWIDIPVAYVTGRRALITFVKGPSGEEIFAKALADWKNK